MKSEEINIVCYHYPCQDGSASAWVASKYAQEHNLTYEYIGMSHGKDNHLGDIAGKNILFVDYAPTDELIKELNEKNVNFYILDHHITNQERMKQYNNCVFDMNKSGVGLTWDYFYPNIEMPMFLQMIQDRDIWTLKLEDTKYFCNGLYVHSTLTESRSEQFELFDKVHQTPDFEQEIKQLGIILHKQKFNKIKRIADSNANQEYSYKGYKVFMYNCDHELASDLGNYMVNKHDYDFAVCWRYSHRDEEYHYSLRSNGKVDVSQICKELGGGGHKNAAGCSSMTHPIILFNDKQEKKSNIIQSIDDIL